MCTDIERFPILYCLNVFSQHRLRHHSRQYYKSLGALVALFACLVCGLPWCAQITSTTGVNEFRSVFACNIIHHFLSLLLPSLTHLPNSRVLLSIVVLLDCRKVASRPQGPIQSTVFLSQAPHCAVVACSRKSRVAAVSEDCW